MSNYRYEALYGYVINKGSRDCHDRKTSKRILSVLLTIAHKMPSVCASMYQKICTRHNLADACLHMVFFICQKFSKGSEPFSSSGKVVGRMTPREYVIQQLQDHNKIRKEISVLEFELKALLTMNSNDLIESMTFVPSVTETVQSSQHI